MLKSMNFKNDSRDSKAQELTECLRLLDLMVHTCYCNNKRKSTEPEYKPRIVIYLGHLEFCALMDLSRNCRDIATTETYRDFPVTLVSEDTHCKVFCLNPVVK